MDHFILENLYVPSGIFRHRSTARSLEKEREGKKRDRNRWSINWKIPTSCRGKRYTHWLFRYSVNIIGHPVGCQDGTGYTSDLRVSIQFRNLPTASMPKQRSNHCHVEQFCSDRWLGHHPDFMSMNDWYFFVVREDKWTTRDELVSALSSKRHARAQRINLNMSISDRHTYACISNADCICENISLQIALLYWSFIAYFINKYQIKNKLLVQIEIW